ncbi:hypothetical protein Zm00014a_004334 [Zea mays]|uniref:Pre-mRNA-processing protein 40A n=1 Tax=Zea mays TaxID=4577 RepID=A0A3L6FK26_MAIZE|nr:Pre-mRNA-processing protein 40A [Zea mays]PWZ32691.1 hypothetical protein Zm00014a_004334 [Zea mays]
MASNMQSSGLPQPPRPPMMGSSAQPQNLGPPMPMQFRPVMPSQHPPQFMPPAAQQFRPVGEPMAGANVGMPGQMPHFPQPGQHLPHSNQVPPVSQGVPMVYQPARPMSSAPMQQQQQTAYAGGHLPTMGAPMQPLTYTYQPTSIPPVAQPWSTGPGQSVHHVPPLVPSGHQPVSAPTTLPPVNLSEPSSSDWQEHTAAEGKKYYYNKKTRQSSWEKPVELMTPLERADASTEWKEFTTPEGRKYYFNKVTKQSKWTIPDELKVARELAENASNQQPDRESGIATSALVRSAAFEPSTAPANQSSSAVGIIASSAHDGSSNSVLSGPPLPHNVENTSSSIVGMQNGGSSTAVVPVAASTEVPLVATDAGSSRNNDENSSLTTGADAEDGTSAEDLVCWREGLYRLQPPRDGGGAADAQAEGRRSTAGRQERRAMEKEAKKTMPVAGKINVTPVEEKTSEEEPVVYATKMEAKNAFKSLLESVNVESDWTWDQTMRVIINDKRYGALKTLGERKQAFNEYLNQRKKFEAEEKRIKQRKARDDFLAMLEESKELTSSTRWSKAILMFEDDERFKAVERPREREDLFENYLVELHKKEKAKAAEEHKRYVAEYRAFLESCDFIKASTQWRKVQERLEDDERYSRLEKFDRLDIFQEYIRHLEKEEEEQKRIKDSQSYLAVASNTSGSTPKELFDDVIEELGKQYQEDKIQIKEVVKSGKIPMTTSWTLEEFQTATLEDDALKGISTINIKLVYDDQLERLKEKEQKDAKKRQRLGENFSDLLYSIKDRALDSETYARELFEECVVHLKERLKEKERLREEEKVNVLSQLWRPHAHGSDSDSENRHKRHKKDRDSSRRNGAHELEDGELGEDGEIY